MISKSEGNRNYIAEIAWRDCILARCAQMAAIWGFPLREFRSRFERLPPLGLRYRRRRCFGRFVVASKVCQRSLERINSRDLGKAQSRKETCCGAKALLSPPLSRNTPQSGLMIMQLQYSSGCLSSGDCGATRTKLQLPEPAFAMAFAHSLPRDWISPEVLCSPSPPLHPSPLSVLRASAFVSSRHPLVHAMISAPGSF